MWRQAVYLTEKAGRGVSRSCFTAWFCTEIGATLKLQSQDFESGFHLGSMLCLMSTAVAPWSFTSALKHQMISNNNVSEHRSLKTGDITDYSASADKGLTSSMSTKNTQTLKQKSVFCNLCCRSLIQAAALPSILNWCLSLLHTGPPGCKNNLSLSLLSVPARNRQVSVLFLFIFPVVFCPP